MRTKKESVLQEIKQAYGDCLCNTEEQWKNCQRELMFHASETVGREEAKEIMREIVPSYNDFRPGLLDKLPDDSQIILGREYSVCIYVKSLNTLPTAEQMDADECDVQSDGSVRYWWG